MAHLMFLLMSTVLNTAKSALEIESTLGRHLLQIPSKGVYLPDRKDYLVAWPAGITVRITYRLRAQVLKTQSTGPNPSFAFYQLCDLGQVA